MRQREDEHTRWSRYVFLVPEKECHYWVGAKKRGGYGHFRRWLDNKWKMYAAHKYAYEYYNGPIPEGMVVRHTCDNACCVNPAHLVLGTTQDNVDDMVQRGRHNPGHKLDRPFVDACRLGWFEGKIKDVKTQSEYAKIMGISPQQMSRILNNQIWK